MTDTKCFECEADLLGPICPKCNPPLGWQPIETAPKDQTIILANFTDRCLLTGAPHVWSSTYVTKWACLDGSSVEDEPMWCEVSYAAMNDNGDPTHWMPLPEPPEDSQYQDSGQ